MMKGETILRFIARALGSATLWGVWVQFAGIPPFAQGGHIAGILLLSAAAFLLLMLLTKMLLRVRYPEALWSMGKSYVSGVLMGLAVASLILLLTEVMTALVGMMTLIRFGG